MKKYLFLICLSAVMLALSCSESDLNGYTYYSENTIFSSEERLQFREVLFSIKPYIKSGDQKLYVLTDSLLSVRVKMNNTLWCSTESLEVDTAAVTKYTAGPYTITDIPVKYNVIAAYEPKQDTLTTAGQYSDLLRAYLNIEPGVYFCQVESFEFRLNDGTLMRVVPFISEMIEITADTRSLFLGEFEVMVDNLVFL